MIVIVDLKTSNLGSISNMLRKIGASDVVVSSDPDTIRKAHKIIFPGVGTFDNAMKKIKELQIQDVLREQALDKKVPFLGICLGMQIMTKSSDEGDQEGLGFLNATTQKFNIQTTRELKIPHMGWNKIRIQKHNALLHTNSDELRFYFVHSYHVVCNDPQDILTETTHGIVFTSSFQHENLWGVQFHPEKSHKFGMNLFKNFLEI